MGDSQTSARDSRAFAALVPLLALGAGCFPDTPELEYSSKAFVVNTTRAALGVRVQAFVGELDCERVEGAASANLARELFEPEATYDLPAGGALPLDVAPTDVAWDPWEPIETCGAKVVQVLGVPDQLVFWPSDLNPVAVGEFAPTGDENLIAQSLRIEGTEGLLGAAAGKRLEASTIGPAGALDALREPPRPFAWSGTFPSGEALITRKSPLPDGCSSIDAQGSDGTTHQTFLCVPDWAFPFEAGETVVFRAPPRVGTTAVRPPSATALMVTDVDARRALEMWLGATDVPIAVEATEQGRAVTRPCGARSSDVALGVTGFPTLGPGTDGERVTSVDTTRILVGRAEYVIVASPHCETERARLGYSIDLLRFTERSEP